MFCFIALSIISNSLFVSRKSLGIVCANFSLLIVGIIGVIGYPIYEAFFVELRLLEKITVNVEFIGD